ncbi:MAG: YbgC/FadM family acyl-CoA thioesterase [Ramlibacter sp.]|nr:YbgC/FadM family acyl-CoA thioesterase [Ramlibacter sp.]
MSGPLRAEPVFAFPIRVYWEDTDAGGIVFYANYLKYFERARTEWLRSLGLGQRALRESTGGIFVVGETSVRFHRPARLDDELLVTARVEEMGRASLIIAQQALLPGGTARPGASSTDKGGFAVPGAGGAARARAGGTLLCDGTIRIGWVEADTLKPARIPAKILEALKQ